MSYILPLADWMVTLAGKDLSPVIRPRLISLTVTAKRAGEADEVDLKLDDSDGLLAIPPAGAKLEVQLGWKRGTGVTIGLVKMGTFIVDDISHDGPPDVLSIKGRSAELAGELHTRREASWHQTTLGQIVKDIAGRHDLKPLCAASLAAIEVPYQALSRESDLAFLRRLGRAHDALATIKHGTLLLAPIGGGQTASGKAIAGLTIARIECGTHSYSHSTRNQADGVTATWHDRDSATRKSVTIGKAAGAKRIARVYASEANAKRGAKAALSHAQREPAKLDLPLSLGRPAIAPETPIQLTGFKAEINAKSWLVAEVSHSLDKSGGFTTKLQLEAAA